MNYERIGQYKYRIRREGKMEVDAAFYASERILEDLGAEDYASLRQLANVATLPGIVEPALTMPDVHWGYGFPIGGSRPSTRKRAAWSARAASVLT
jgi:tRNA-splicing ligase RtcB